MNVIICPVRAGLEMTQEAIESFYAQDIGDIYVLLVDNSPNHEMQKSLRYNGCIHANEPMGVSKSWNTALGSIFESTSHVLVCNNDIVLRQDAYRLLLEDGGGFVTCVGDANRDAIWGEPRPLDKRPHPDFACYLIRQWVWEKVGKFDETFKGAYCEDNDYHLRMHQAGVDAHCIGVPFYHRVSGTIKHLSDDDAIKVHNQAHANREYFRQKWGCLPGDEKYYEYFKEQG